MTTAEIMAVYYECGGRPISEYRLRYFDLLRCLNFITPCQNALTTYQRNEDANIELCRLGFYYAYAGVKSVNEKITLAEQAKGSV